MSALGVSLLRHLTRSWWVYSLAAMTTFAIGWPALLDARSIILALSTSLLSTLWIASLIHTSRSPVPYHLAWAGTAVLLSFLSPLLYVLCTYDGSSALPRWWMVMGLVFSIIIVVIVAKRRVQEQAKE